MFSNQISSRDLYSASDNLDKGYSTERDFSQLQNAQFTQFDNSQYSQDFFSQTQGSTGSAESQGRKFQPFEKYMAKPSLFRGNSQGRGPPQTRPGNSQLLNREPQQAARQQVTSFQHQVNINKNKAKERDERDMLSSIVHIVKECSDEVKQSLNVLKDGETENSEKLKSTLVSLTHQIKESSDKILKTVQSREEQVSMVERLQRLLLEKEERIQELLTQQQNSNSGQENAKTLVEAMKTFMSDQQNETDKRLQKLLEATQEELRLLKDQASVQRNASDENNKNFQDMKYSTNRQIQDVEKRVVDELLHIRDDFERQKRDMESFYKNHLQTQQQKQTREITQHLDRGLENISKPDTDFDLLEKQTDLFTEVCKKQQKELVSAVKAVVNDQSKHYLHQNQRDLNVLQHNIVNDLDRKFDDLKVAKEMEVQMITDHIDKSIEDKSASWKNDLVPKKVQAQLDELHNQHKSEIQKLEKQIEEQRKNAEEIASHKKDPEPMMTESVLQNVYDINTEERRQNESKTKPSGPLFQRASGFISPRPPVGTTWNSRAIFGRTNPSPVATVLPQRHTATLTKDDDGLASVGSLVPQQNSRMQQAVIARIQPPRQAEAPDHVVPATPESAREMMEHSQMSLTDTESPQETFEESEVVEAPQVLTKAIAKKSGPKKKGRKKKRVYTKKPKAKLKSYQKHQKITKTQDTVVTSTQALAVYDFADELSPQPLIRKSTILKQVNPLPSYESGSFEPTDMASGSDRLCLENDSSQSDSSSQGSTPALPHIDVFMKRKVGHTERTSPMKQEKPGDAGCQGLLYQHDFLSTPNLTVQKTVTSEATNVLKAEKAKNVRRFEPKRKLCDFDYQIVNLLECVQKKKKINV